MTPAQLRMARAAIDLTVRKVEALTGVNKNTVSRYEAGKEILAGAHQKLEQLFSDRGLIFLKEDAEGGDGVRLPARKPISKSKERSKSARLGKRSQKIK